MAKARKGSRKPASRAKGTKKSAAKRTKKAGAKPKALAVKTTKQVSPSLDLKKLLDDIGKAKTALSRHQPGGDPEKQKKLEDTQSALDRWTLDINSICGGAVPGDEPCGDTMLIS